jgi:hypothetical protein
MIVEHVVPHNIHVSIKTFSERSEKGRHSPLDCSCHSVASRARRSWAAFGIGCASAKDCSTTIPGANMTINP